MAELSLIGKELRKDFNWRTVFDHISFEISSGDSLAITGRNGSGKTTLLKIISGLLTPTSGSLILRVDKSDLRTELRREYLGFVSPYLQLYDEFTGYENLLIAARIRGRPEILREARKLLEHIGLTSAKDYPVATYSSGMKQRLKYAFALLHRPILLLLDEPMTNLDGEGIETVRGIIEEQKERGVVIIATNDSQEAKICRQNLDLDQVRARLDAAFESSPS